MTLKFSRLKTTLLAAAALAVSVPAGAQILGSQAGLSLSHYLTLLAEDPRDVRALLGAGEAAQELGDAEAAMGFFQRAEAADPRDGRARAGMARLWLSQEKPADAIKGFDAAVKMGVAEASVASDRGLAYDLRGDPRRAQRDYAIAVRRGGDDEAIRRYALSLGISGDRDQALKMLDPLLIKQDRAAWRARAFVLAMSGDVAGARGIADAVMPTVAQPMMPFFTRLRGLSPGQRAAAVHFGHIPSDGRSDGRGNYDLAAPPEGRIASADGPLTPAESLNARPAEVPASSAKVSTDPRRRPGQPVETRATARPVQVARADARTDSRAARAAKEPRPKPGAPVRVALADLPPVARAQLERTPDPVTAAVVARTQADASAVAAAETGKVDPAPGRSQVQPLDFAMRAAPGASPPSSVPFSPPASSPSNTAPVGVLPPAPEARILPTPVPIPEPPKVVPPPVSLVAIVAELKEEPAAVTPAPRAVEAVKPPAPRPAAVVVAKPRPEPVKAVDKAKAEHAKPGGKPAAVEKPGSKTAGADKPGAKVPTAAEKKAADKKLADKKLADKKIADKKIADKKLADKKAAAKPDPKKLHPERVWAQVATGANPAALVKDFDKLAKKSPGAFKGRSGWSVPFKGTRRLLVGPFATQKQAMDFLAKAGITGIPFESPAGMEISKLSGK